MLFTCQNGYLKASRQQNDFFVRAYNVRKNNNLKAFISESEIGQFKEFMNEKRPSVSVDVIYGAEEV